MSTTTSAVVRGVEDDGRRDRYVRDGQLGHDGIDGTLMSRIAVGGSDQGPNVTLPGGFVVMKCMLLIYGNENVVDVDGARPEVRLIRRTDGLNRS